MKTIGLLQFRSRSDELIFSKWNAIAAEFGAQIKWVSEAPGRPDGNFDADELRDLVQTSDAFIVVDATPLDLVDLSEILHSRIQAGVRFYMEFNRNGLEAMNRFMGRYGIKCESATVSTKQASGIPGASPGLVVIKRDSSIHRDSELFVKVPEVTASYPRLLSYWGESSASFIPFPESIFLTDFGDCFMLLETRTPTFLAKWSGFDGQGAIVSSAGLFYDSYFGPMGEPWPGIDANPYLAKNVARYLLKSYGLPISPYERYQRIEENLSEFVIYRLKHECSDWWDRYVPEDVRAQCERKRQQESSQRVLWAYLDFIQLKKIMHAQWDLYDPFVRQLTGEDSKKKNLAWMDKINEVRKSIAHPMRPFLAGESLGSAELQSLEEADVLCGKLSVVARQAGWLPSN